MTDEIESPLFKLKNLVSSGLIFPESPRWRNGALYFSDIMAGRVLRADLSGAVEEVASYNGWLSGLGWLPDDTLLVVSMNDQKLLRLDEQDLVEFADLSECTTKHPNDMIVDGCGNAFISEVGYDIHGGEDFRPANLTRVTRKGEVAVAASGLATPNGMAITPDGKTLIVAESIEGRLTAFDLDEDGLLSGRRPWAKLPGGAMPDGICMDGEGAVWVALPFEKSVIRVMEGGSVTAQICTPGNLPLACALGGPDMADLFICKADPPDPSGPTAGGGEIWVAGGAAPK